MRRRFDSAPLTLNIWVKAILLLALPAIAPVSASAAGAAAVSVGNHHACVLTSDGGVECWGSNFYGELGDGSTSSHSVPVPVSGLSGVIVSVSPGGDHTCALDDSGGVYCWGASYRGQLGNGTYQQSTVPVAVSGLASGVSAIAAGSEHTCALTTAGAVFCWGSNELRQLGNGGTANSNAPVPVSGLSSGVVAITAGAAHTCALTTSGGVLCWGSNEYGQIGDGSTANRDVPVAVSGLSSGISAIALGGHHSCAIKTGGAAFCWGDNRAGQLGNGTLTWQPAPVPVSIGLSGGLSSITAGYDFTCALDTAGGAWCWGENGYGQLGDGWASNRSDPWSVTGLASGVVEISSGFASTCALDAGANVQCWGANHYGELGDGSVSSSAVPVPTAGPEIATSLGGGFYHTCALNSAGGVDCWGSNLAGQMGDGSGADHNVPRPVPGLTSGVSALSVGSGDHTCAVDDAGGVKCWGANDHGQLGNGTNQGSDVPVSVVGLASSVAMVAAGFAHTCAITTAAGLECWGDNSAGQLGNGTTVSSSVPVPVLGMSTGVVAVVAGSDHTCALVSSGAAWCWGSNAYGQLGSPVGVESALPVPVVGLSSGTAAIAAGIEHNCALTAAGGVLCWGKNDRGQLGDGTDSNRDTPVAASGLSAGVEAIAAGTTHTCAVRTGGSVECWGQNYFGELGPGPSFGSLYSPTPVPGLASGVSAVFLGFVHTCAITSGGVVQCLGYNGWLAAGQLGDGSVAFSRVRRGVVGYYDHPACNDGIDNDGDGGTDFPSDAECEYGRGLSELPEAGQLAMLAAGLVLLRGMNRFRARARAGLVSARRLRLDRRTA